jgi:hypothetical protein
MRLLTYRSFFAYGLCTVLLLLATSCDSILEVKPKQSIDSKTALTTEEELQAAVIGVYDRLQSTRLYGRDLIAIPEALSDNGKATNKSGRLNAEYQNQPNSHFLNWRLSYFGINQINLILAASPTVELSDASRNSIEGQAYFLRALFYFDLIRAYSYTPTAKVDQQNRGGVPLVTTGAIAEKDITFPARASVEEVYQFIYADLEKAIAKLEGTAASRAPQYATQAAAKALFSRVALYNSDWANSAKYATEAIGAGIGKFQTRPEDYFSAWRVPINPESIFELSFQIPENIGVNEALQTTFTTLVEPGNRAKTGGFGDLVPTESLLEALSDAGDVRRRLYELGTAGRGAAQIECTKFIGKNGKINLDNVPVIRISEMYLNRAEANYHLGNEEDALTDINAIRTRSGLNALTDVSGEALLTEILKQRRVELAFEGHRFFDLKRQGLDIVKAAPVQTLPFTDYRVLAPIPPREIQANPNLVQNYGY